MKKSKKIIILTNLVILLGYFAYSVFKKEKLLSEGQLVLLELAPVDPRSLMQGDYMRLNYAISREARHDSSVTKRGYCVLKVEDDGTAQHIRFQATDTPVYEGELLISYTSENSWNFNIGAQSYFFQEGEAEKYESAKYGGLKVDRYGNSLLIDLYDENKNKIE